MSSEAPPLAIQSAASKRAHLCLIEACERVFGREVAEIVWRGLAGQRFYVARRPSADNQLARLIGLDKATMIAGELGGVTLDVPTNIGIRHRRVIRLRKACKPASEIARKTGYSERHVYRLLREARDAGYLPARRLPGGRRRASSSGEQP